MNAAVAEATAAMAPAPADQMDSARSDHTGGVNLRDIAVTDASRIRSGLVYRSSERFRFEKVDKDDIASSLDLREQPPECKRLVKRQLLSSLFKAPVEVLPDRMKLTSLRSQPAACDRCTKRMSDLCEREVSVHHVNLLPPRMKLRIFADMPWSVRLRTAFAPLKGGSPKAVIEPRVGDPDVLPFDMLYRQILDLSKRPIAKALRIFVHGDNLPVIVHCTQGRDRTGIIIALLLRTLGTDAHAIAMDYADSDVHLQKQDDFEAGAGFDEGQMRDETTPENLRVMEAMLQHVDEHYDGIMGYLRHIGLNDDEIKSIQDNLLQPAAKAAMPPVNSSIQRNGPS